MFKHYFYYSYFVQHLSLVVISNFYESNEFSFVFQEREIPEDDPRLVLVSNTLNSLRLKVGRQ